MQILRKLQKIWLFAIGLMIQQVSSKFVFHYIIFPEYAYEFRKAQNVVAVSLNMKDNETVVM